MTPYYERNGITIYCGDCLEVMRSLPDNSIDSIITDPPYELDFMNKKWDGSGIAFNVEVWREALRVAKPGATLMAFGGTRTHHRLACAIEDAGWEIRDCISYFHDGNQQEQALMASLDDEQLAAYLELHYPNHQMSWVYGSGIGLGHNVSKGIDKAKGMEREVIGNKLVSRDLSRNGQKGDMAISNGDVHATNISITAPASPLAKKFDGWNSRLKPSFEPIIVAMKPLDGTYAQNAERWAVSGLWIDGGRIPTSDYLGAKTPGLRAIHNKQQEQGARPESYYKDHKPRLINNSGNKGRYPANTIHSNEPGVLAEFDKAGVRTSGARNGVRIARKSFGDNGAFTEKARDTGKHSEASQGSAARYFAQCPPDTQPARFIYNAKAPKSERSTPGNNHPTQKPLSLIQYLCRLTKTPDGGVVLDLFGGSGTTALACIAEGRECILIEKHPPYVEIIKRRIAEYAGQEVQAKEVTTPNGTTKQMSLW